MKETNDTLKKKEKKEKKDLLFLKVTNHIGQETFVFIHEIGLYNMKTMSGSFIVKTVGLPRSWMTVFLNSQ